MKFHPNYKQTNNELLLSGPYVMIAEEYSKICTSHKLSSTCLILYLVCTELLYVAILLSAKYFGYRL